MKKVLSADLAKQTGRSVACGSNEGTAAEPLEVNVIFTEPAATAAALRAAAVFARELGACIRLRAGIVVPVQLPLDQPLVSVDFFERVLRDLVDHSEADGIERTIHLYICRDWVDALAQLLKPSSVVVVGGRKRWWPTAAGRLARALRDLGNRVIFVDVSVQPVGN